LSRKIFKHNFVKPIELGEEYIDGKRHYVLEDGTKLKSVTTVLSEKSDKTFLENWKRKLGEEESQKVITQANRRGSSVHALAERYILNEEDYIKKEMPVNVDTFNQIKKYLDKYVDDVYGIELPLYSKTLKTAGRTDLIAEYCGETSIIDFKTSRKVKKEEWIQNYFLQATVYSMMFEYLYKIKVPQIVIIMAVDNDHPLVFVRERKNYVEQVLEIFNGE
jgi:genome maintenance exonuclease 1